MTRLRLDQIKNPFGGGSLSIDAAMSSSSTNPVQNQVIYDALMSSNYATSVPINKSSDSTTYASLSITRPGSYLIVVSSRLYQGTYSYDVSPIFHYDIKLNNTGDPVTSVITREYVFTSTAIVVYLAAGTHSLDYSGYGSGGNITTRGAAYLLK